MKSVTTTIDYKFTFNINKLIEQILSFNYIVHLFSGPPDSGLSCHGSDNPSHLACQVLMMFMVVLVSDILLAVWLVPMIKFGSINK